ncbi:MAG: hypothetical protein SGCHY_003764 [Lobulomycetales sp.]
MFWTALPLLLVALSISPSAQAKDRKFKWETLDKPFRPHKTPPADRIVRVQDQHYYDSHGRQRFFRGLNVVYKGAPYHPETHRFDPLTSFSWEDVQLLSDLNINVIRLGVEWAGVEKIRGQYNQTYIDIIHHIVGMCEKKGIYVMLDFHQDLWSEKYCGEGAPDWAAIHDPDSRFPKPLFNKPYTVNEKGHPSAEDCAKHDWYDYHASYAFASAMQNFYDNKDGIRDSFAQFWKEIARNFVKYDNVLGYNLINEPFAGNVWRRKKYFLPGYGDFENLEPLYQSVHEAIRQVDTKKIIFFEGITWDNWKVGFKNVPGMDTYQNRSALSYHHYFPLPNVLGLKSTIKKRIRDAKRLNAGLFLTEFDVNVMTVMKRPAKPSKILGYLEACDELLQSWIGWNYKPLVAITGPGETIINSKTGDIRSEWVMLFSRTYAHAVAGNVKTMNFNNATREFSLVYTPDLEISRAATEIRLMQREFYPEGFQVKILPLGIAHMYLVRDNENAIMVKLLDGATEKLGEDQTIEIRVQPLGMLPEPKKKQSPIDESDPVGFYYIDSYEDFFALDES